MKLKTLLTKAKKEIKEDNEKRALEVVKESLNAVNEAKKTVNKLEKAHSKLLDSDLEDLELNNFEY